MSVLLLLFGGGIHLQMRKGIHTQHTLQNSDKGQQQNLTCAVAFTVPDVRTGAVLIASHTSSVMRPSLFTPEPATIRMCVCARAMPYRAVPYIFDWVWFRCVGGWAASPTRYAGGDARCLTTNTTHSAAPGAAPPPLQSRAVQTPRAGTRHASPRRSRPQWCGCRPMYVCFGCYVGGGGWGGAVGQPVGPSAASRRPLSFVE